MSGNLQLYTLVYVSIAGALLTQEGSVSMRRTTGSQAVGTVPNGYSGESPGMYMCEIEIESAIPMAAIEYDPATVMLGLLPIEVGFIMAGKTAVAKGFIIEDDYKHALNQESKQTMRFRGGMPVFS